MREKVKWGKVKRGKGRFVFLLLPIPPFNPFPSSPLILSIASLARLSFRARRNFLYTRGARVSYNGRPKA